MFGRKKEDTTAIERITWQIVKGMISLLIFFIVLVLVVMPLIEKHFGISIFGGNKSNSALEVVEPAMTVSYLDEVGHFASIKGSIKNTTDERQAKARVEFDLFDKDGNKIGNAVALVGEIEGGGVEVFEAGVTAPLSEKPATFKVKRIVNMP